MIETIKHNPITYKLYNFMTNSNKYVGKENAISGKQLSKIMGVSERKLRDYVREWRRSLILEKQISSFSGGYYIATKEESQQTITMLYHTAISLLHTARALERKVSLDNQTKIKLGKYYKEAFETFADTEVSDIEQNN